MFEFLIIVVGVLAGIAGTVAVVLLLRRGSEDAKVRMDHDVVADRVRAVGKLIGLEVHAKEIVTSTKGWSWMPPILLSQAKIAMIFHFDKQYYIDLSRLSARDVDEYVPGHFRITLPPIEGSLRLTDVSPYDIQAGRILGLLDVIQMNAKTQKELMQSAQEQAATLFTKHEAAYFNDARISIERHLNSLFALFDVDIEIQWSDETAPAGELVMGESFSAKLVG